MKIEETFSFTVQEQQASLTSNIHQTIEFLHRQGYINEKDALELVETVVAVCVKNDSLYGRIKNWLFPYDTPENTYKFVIAKIYKTNEEEE